MSIALLRPQWPVAPQVRAAFSLRGGGASEAPYDSLNLGDHVGDSAESVAENRLRLRATLKLPAEPLWLRQVHGTRVCDADVDWPAGGISPVDVAPADACITRRPGRVLAILVADCMPVLLAAATGKVIAAAHAGWRGLAAGVLEATVAAMRCEPAQLHAWLGPAIGAAHFEVGEEVRAAFLAADAHAATAFTVNARGRWQCDLALLARQRLQRLGVTAISGGDCCTYADATRFYSYRRDGRTGRMAALLWLQP
jgi:hypothetical protein